MSEQCYPTPEELQRLAANAETINEYVNGDEGVPNVNPDGADVKNLATLNAEVLQIAQIPSNATWRSTLDELESVTDKPVGSIGVVTSDGLNNGFYEWSGTSAGWVRTEWQPVTEQTVETAFDAVAAAITQAGLKQYEFHNEFPAPEGLTDVAKVVLDADGRVIGKVGTNGQSSIYGVGGDDTVNSSQYYEFINSAEVASLRVAKAYVDSQGVVFAHITKNAEFVIPNESGSAGSVEGATTSLDDFDPDTLDEVYVEDGVLYRRNWLGTETVVKDPSPNQFIGSPRWVGRSILVRLDRPLFDGTSAVLVSKNGEMTIPSPYRLIEVIAGYGQSNMTGGVYTGPVPTFRVIHPNMLMLAQSTGDSVRAPSSGSALDADNVTGFTPLRSTLAAGDDEATDSQGASSLEGIAWRLGENLKNYMGVAPRYVFFTAARGGRAIANLGPGSTPYVNFMTALERTVEIAAENGDLVVLRNVIFTQGEADTGNSGWSSALRTLRSNMNSDIKALTGQDVDVHFILAQPSTFGGTRNVLQQLSVSKQYPAEFSLSHPGYALSYAGPDWNPSSPWLHMDSKGNVQKGEYEAKVLMARTFDFKAWTGLRPKTFTYDAPTQTLDILCDVPVGPLAIDDDLPSYGNNSIVVTDDDGEPDFVVSVVNSDTLRLVFDRPLVGTKTISYAMRPYQSDENGRIEGTGPFGPIRDSDATPSLLDGRPLYNMMAHFQQDF